MGRQTRTGYTGVMKTNAADPRTVLLSPDSYASTLLVLALDQYGPEMLRWSPQTLRMQLEEDYGVEMPPAAMDRLLAAVMLLTTDDFFTSVDRFIAICNVLAGGRFDPEVFVPADVAECAWGISEALLLNPPDTKEPFSEEICAYLAEELKEEGFATAPDVLRIALDADRTSQVQDDFASDPEMFAGIWKIQREKTEDINSMLRENLTQLLHQIRALPLTRGNAGKLPALSGLGAARNQ